MSQADRDFLSALNGGVNSVSNPGGLNGAGTGRLFVQALNAMGAVGNEVVALAADMAQRAASVGVAADAATGLITNVNQTNDLLVGLRDSTLAAAAAVRRGEADGVAELGPDGKLPSGRLPAHTHGQSDVTGLTAALTGKAAADLSNVANTDFVAKASSAGVGGGQTLTLSCTAPATIRQPIAVAPDGTVAPVAQSGGSSGVATQILATFEGGQSGVACWVTSLARLYVVFKDGGDSDKLKCAVYQRSGAALSLVGAATQIGTLSNRGILTMCYDTAANRLILCHHSGGGADQYVLVGAPSATSVTWGTGVQINASYRGWLVYDGAINRPVVASHHVSTYAMHVDVLAVNTSTNSVSVSVTTSTGAFTAYNSLRAVFVPSAGRIVVDVNTNSGPLYHRMLCIQAGVSAIAIGAPVAWDGANSGMRPMAALSGGRFLMVYSKNSTSDGGPYARVVTIDAVANTLSFGIENSLRNGGLGAANAQYDTLVADAVNSTYALAHTDASGYLRCTTGTVSGDTVARVSDFTILSAAAGLVQTVALDGAYCAVLGRVSSGGALNGYVLSPLSSTNAYCIGFAAETISAAGPLKITPRGGAVSGYAGLTAGATYYLGIDGTLSTSGGVEIGRAISATTILTKGL